MEYKGYSAKVEFDESANVFHGEVLHLRDVITFEATTVDDLWEEFRDSINDYLDFCRTRGEEPERPFSGKFMVRIDPDLHRSAAVAAAKAGHSLNAWVSGAIESRIQSRQAASVENLRHLESAFITVLKKNLTVDVKTHEPAQERLMLSGHHQTGRQLNRVFLLENAITPTLETSHDWAHS
jgi:predicted HicB family RNase H-like nuclease